MHKLWEEKTVGSLLDINRFKLDEKEEYAHYTNLTAKLLKRLYMTVHLIFEREKWTFEKIRDRYKQCTERNGDMPKDVLWWYLRKKDNESEKAKSET